MNVNRHDMQIKIDQIDLTKKPELSSVACYMNITLGHMQTNLCILFST